MEYDEKYYTEQAVRFAKEFLLRTGEEFENIEDMEFFLQCVMPDTFASIHQLGKDIFAGVKNGYPIELQFEVARKYYKKLNIC